MKIEVLCSGVTGKIYIANVNAKGHIRKKVDMTQQVINAVMQHMDSTKLDYECVAGELIYKPKGSNPTEVQG
jgi:hypothetical protein